MKESTKRRITWLLICLTLAMFYRVLSIVFISNEKYKLLVVLIPLFLALAINILSVVIKGIKKKFLNSAFILSMVVYLLIDLYIDNSTFQRNFVLVILVLTTIYLITLLPSTHDNEQDSYEDSSN